MNDNIIRFTWQGQETLTLPAERSAFEQLKNWICDIAAEVALPEKAEKQLIIAADEIFTNIACYGYPRGCGTASVTVQFDPAAGEFIMMFTDNGEPFNPLDIPEPELNDPLAERCPGGLGIFLAKKLMDSLEYRRENGRNILILKKSAKGDTL